MRYQNHTVIYDIGCDHGKLGRSFRDEPWVTSIHLVDPSSDVIKNLLGSHIPEQDFKIQIEHKNGQDLVLRPGSKLILIAGMGGKEIGSILTHLLPQLSSSDDIVISPHRDLLQLRESLSLSPFYLKDESLVFDEGRYYQVISLNLEGTEKVHLYGNKLWEGEHGPGYREHQKLHFSAHQDTRSRAYVSFLRSLT